MTLNTRMTITAGCAVVLVSTVLYPVFIGSGWFYAGIGAVIAVGAAGTLSRLRTLPVVVCVAITLLALLLYLNLVFEARHSWIGIIPTPGSVSRLWRLAGTGFTDSRKYAPAVPELSGLVLLSTAGIGLTAIMTDLIAVRLRSTALAGLPLLVLFTVPVAINAPHSQLSTGVIFCLGTAGYLAMLSADGRERIRVWGRLVSLWRTGWLHESTTYNVSAYNGSSGAGGSARSGGSAGSGSAGSGGRDSRGGSRIGPDTRALAAAGRRVGLASVVLALCAPLLLPGLHPSKLFASGPGIGGTGGSGGGSAVGLPNALLQIATQLQEKTPTQVLTYTTTASQNVQTYDPQYLREASYDTLTDSGWMPDYAAGAAQLGTLPSPQGQAPGLSAEHVITRVSVAADVPTSSLTFLPMPYPPAQVAVSAPGLWLTDPELMVFSNGGSIAGRSYTVDSLVVDPSAADLKEAPAPPLASLRPDLALPTSYQLASLKQLAEQVTAGKKTEYDKVNALALFLADNGIYSTSVRPFTGAPGMVAFLTTKTGSCVQFAWTMTVLARLLGIPARLATGFTAGTQAKRPDSYVVKTSDSHAWTEVYFQDYGWIRFEPTPAGQGTAVPPNYMGNGHGTGTIIGPPIKNGSGSAGNTNAGNTSRTHLVQGRSGEGPTVTLPATASTASTPWTAIALAVLAAIALACGVIALVAPPAQRALSSHAAETPRRRRPATLAAGLVVLAAIVALALYRVLSRTSGLDLRVGWATVGLAFALACVVALVVPGTARMVLRRWRWMRATDDVSRAHAAWREFRDDLADLGVGCRPSEPPRTLAGRVTAGLPEPAAAAVRRLALAEERARYAASPAQSQALRRDGVTARRGIAATARRGARWRALIFPTSLLTALADTAARVTERVVTLLSRRPERGSAS